MKLLSVYIDNYKNLSGKYDFTRQDGYIALIGENGSGKSNLLEAISLIFNGIHNKKKIPFNYEIQYEHEGKTYLRKSRIAMIDGIKVKESEMIYPSCVIACYSGEDLRLWHMAFEDYHMHYFKRAINNKVTTPKLLYINKYCWNIALISLLCSENAKVKHFLETNFDITDLEKVEVTFEFSKQDYFRDHQSLKWINRIKDKCLDENGKATLKSILSYDIPLLPNQTKESTIFHYLYLLSQPKKNQEKGNAIDKYITKIRVENKNISSFNFSEGHKKLILIKCITEILGDSSSVLLLDEPDAHIHIARKKELLGSIGTFEGQAILTTHSPVFVNEIYRHHKDCLFHMENGKILSSQYINALTQLTAGEIDYINGTIVLSSKYLLITEGPNDKRYLEKALEIFCNRDEKYKVLQQLAIIPSNSAGNADTFFEQVLMPQIEKYDKIVFIFDYDEGGYSGWKKIKAKGDAKLGAIFYQHDYSLTLNTSKSPQNSETIMVEDLFAPKSYKKKIDWFRLEHKTTHKEFRTFTTNISSAIKSYIESNYNTFDDDDYDGFKPIMDKLIDIFNL